MPPTRRERSQAARSVANAVADRTQSLFASRQAAAKEAEQRVEEYKLYGVCKILVLKPCTKERILKVARKWAVDPEKLAARCVRYLEEDDRAAIEYVLMCEQVKEKEEADQKLKRMPTVEQETNIVEFVKLNRHQEEGATIKHLGLFLREYIYCGFSGTHTLEELEEYIHGLVSRHPTLVYDEAAQRLFSRTAEVSRANARLAGRTGETEMNNTADAKETRVRKASRRNARSPTKQDAPSMARISSSPTSLDLNTETHAAEESEEEEDAEQYQPASPIKMFRSNKSSTNPPPNPKGNQEDQSVEHKMAWHLLRAREVVEVHHKPLRLAISVLDEAAEKALSSGEFELSVMLQEEADFQRLLMKSLRGRGDSCIDWTGEPTYVLRPRKNDQAVGYIKEFRTHWKAVEDCRAKGEKSYLGNSPV